MERTIAVQDYASTEGKRALEGEAGPAEKRMRGYEAISASEFDAVLDEITADETQRAFEEEKRERFDSVMSIIAGRLPKLTDEGLLKLIDNALQKGEQTTPREYDEIDAYIDRMYKNLSILEYDTTDLLRSEKDRVNELNTEVQAWFTKGTDKFKVSLPYDTLLQEDKQGWKGILNAFERYFDRHSISSLNIEMTVMRFPVKGEFYHSNRPVNWRFIPAFVILPNPTHYNTFFATTISMETRYCWLPDEISPVIPRMRRNGFDLHHIRLPSDLGFVPDFQYKFTLQSIILPANINEVPRKAFEKSRLKRVKFRGNTLRVIRQSAFQFSKFESIELPEGVTHIESQAFFRCTNLKTVHLPSSLREIGAGAFFDVDALKTLNIPKSVRSIGRFAFAGSDLVLTFCSQQFDDEHVQALRRHVREIILEDCE